MSTTHSRSRSPEATMSPTTLRRKSSRSCSRLEALDGIAYRSAFGVGLNVVLYDVRAAELINCSLFRLEQLSFKFAEAANPYFISKHYGRANKGDT
jgi:hypothetical protein